MWYWKDSQMVTMLCCVRAPKFEEPIGQVPEHETEGWLLIMNIGAANTKSLKPNKGRAWTPCMCVETIAHGEETERDTSNL